MRLLVLACALLAAPLATAAATVTLVLPTPDGPLVATWDGAQANLTLHAGAGPTRLGTAPTPIIAGSVAPDGATVILGRRQWIGQWQPGTQLEERYSQTRFAAEPFHGQAVRWSTDGTYALVAGSSLLALTRDGVVQVVHGGQNLLFTAVAPLPTGDWLLGDVQDLNGTVHTGLIHRFRAEGVEPGGTLQLSHVSYLGRLRVEGRDGLVTDIVAVPRGAVAGGAVATAGALLRLQQDQEGGWQATALPPALPDPVRWLHAADGWVLALAGDRIYAAAGGVAAPYHDVTPGTVAVPAPDGILLWDGTRATTQPYPAGPLPALINPPSEALVGDRIEVLARVATPGTATNATITASIGNATLQLTRNATLGLYHGILDTADHPDGPAALELTLAQDDWRASWSTPVTVDHGRLTPQPVLDLRAEGLEGTLDADGAFQILWTPQPGFNYDIEHTAEGVNERWRVTKPPVSVVGLNDAEHAFRVRAVSLHADGPWSPPLGVRVVLDRDGDGVPDAQDPRPLTPDRWGDLDLDGVPDDEELRNCSDAADSRSTPATDDDGDGKPNFVECAEGTDPRSPPSPPPANGPPPDDGDDGRSIPAPVVPALVFTLAAARARSTARSARASSADPPRARR